MNIYSIQVNPRVVTQSDESCWFWESCLSIPGPIGWVRRPSRVVVEGCDEHGVQRAPIELDAYAARIFQHELDHLDGVVSFYFSLDHMTEYFTNLMTNLMMLISLQLYTERIDFSGDGVLLDAELAEYQEEWEEWGEARFKELGEVLPVPSACRTPPGQLFYERD